MTHRYDLTFSRSKVRAICLDVRSNTAGRKSRFSISLSVCIVAAITGIGATVDTVAYSAEQSVLSYTEIDSQDVQFHNIMQHANEALAHRDAPVALLRYEQAATQFGEKPEAELGQVRVHLLGGSFREALAFANLVVGEHADFPPAIALLAFIEDRSGHMEMAIARLEAALSRRPNSPSLRAALAEILIDRGNVTKAVSLLDTWIGQHSNDADILRLRARAAMHVGDAKALSVWRLRSADAYATMGQRARSQLFSNPEKPKSFVPGTVSGIYSMDDWPPPAFEPWPTANLNQSNVGNGVVIDAGKRVITAASRTASVGDRAYVRNGLGQMRKAIVESRDDASGLAVLLLDAPYEIKSAIAPANVKAAKPGGFCFALGFPVVGDIDGNFPVLSQGIVVRTRMGSAALTQFTAWLSPDQRGAPLFDSAGNLIGIYRGNGDQIEQARQDGLGNGNFAAGIDAIITHTKERDATQTPPTSIPAAHSTDELYEKLLPAVLSIVVIR